MLDVAAIRRECARVARQGRFVRVIDERVSDYAAALPELPPYPPPVATLEEAASALPLSTWPATRSTSARDGFPRCASARGARDR